MASLTKTSKRKAPVPAVEDDPLELLADAQFDPSLSPDPASAPKKSKASATGGDGDSTPAPASQTSKTPRPPSRGKGKGVLTPELVARETPGSRRDSDRPSSAHPSTGRSSQPPPRSMAVDPHLVPTVTALTDSIPRGFLREEGLDRADTMGYLQALLKSLSRVCASHTLSFMFHALFSTPNLSVRFRPPTLFVVRSQLPSLPVAIGRRESPTWRKTTPTFAGSSPR